MITPHDHPSAVVLQSADPNDFKSMKSMSYLQAVFYEGTATLACAFREPRLSLLAPNKVVDFILL